MQYLECLFKIILLQFIIIILHELLHLFIAKLFKFKLQSIYFIPFKFSKRKTFGWDFNIIFNKNFSCTSYSTYLSKKISTSTEYSLLLKKLSIILWSGPIFDFSIFVLLFVIGASSVTHSYLILLSLLHFAISTMNFFNSDGKYAIGSKEDYRIAYNLVSNYTLFSCNHPDDSTKRIMTDKHMKVANDISLAHFNVNDLWNFLNNVSFYTSSLLSYLNKDIYSLHQSTEEFFELLIEDFDLIKELDYRQSSKVCKSIILYLIYKKSCSINFEFPLDLYFKLINNVNDSLYYHLLNYYFEGIHSDLVVNKKILLNEINKDNSNYIKFL